MIYTTYFANLKNLDRKISCPIAICGKSPNGYKGLEYKKLAPKYDFFKVWKETHDNDYYIKHFNDEVLSKLTLKQVIEDICALINNRYGFNYKRLEDMYFDIYLVCYEKPENFCHRHLVAEWFNKNGVEVKEI